MDIPKVSIVIPVYKPDERVFNLLKEKLKKQTIPVEIIEKWNNPEPVSMNLGIKEAKGEIIVILAQDCIPADEKYIEKLTKPLEDEKVVAVVSDLLLPYEEWKKRPFLSRMFTINDLKLRKPDMNLSSCAYRKRDLEKIGYINENISAIDVDYKKTLKTFYNYSKYNGISVKENKIKEHGFIQKVLRAIPFLGFTSIYYRYPLKNYYYLILIHLLFGAVIEHVINVIGFWQGFLFGEEPGKRNKEALSKNI